MQLPEQNDSLAHDQCILRDAHKNLVAVDFKEEKMLCFVVVKEKQQSRCIVKQ